jgi:hypothetical protein
MSAQTEMWRVSTIEGVFETDLETLKQWIAEGCVLPSDQVQKGSLNWVEASRAPMLRLAFAGQSGLIPSLQTPTNNAEQNSPSAAQAGLENFSSSVSVYKAPLSPNLAGMTVLTNACRNHPQAPPQYICRACAATLCEVCPKIVSKIPLCPLCGELCKPYAEVQIKVAHKEFQSYAFGFADLSRALAYPLQHKVALLCGAAVYGFLLLAGFRGHVIAWVIMFGCISHVISQVAWGRLNRNFLPDFSAFSPWDDVAVPIGLGIGITVVTWGPVIGLVLALLFGVVSGPRLSPLGATQGEAEQHSLAPSPEELAALTDPDADPEKLAEANKKLDQLRPEYQISQEAERSKQEQNDPTAAFRFFMSHLRAPILIVLLFLLSLAWAIFYYPMALAVAGYTQSFGSVINPLVGLDTIRRMGTTYFKAFGMVLLIQVVGFIVSVIVAMVTAPFALPFVGNLPAGFINASVTFYFNLVIACLLGLSLYRCADRLGINVD